MFIFKVKIILKKFTKYFLIFLKFWNFFFKNNFFCSPQNIRLLSFQDDQNRMKNLASF
jgi:hypothetical protein